MIDFKRLGAPTFAGEPIAVDASTNGSVSRRGTRDHASDHQEDEAQKPVFITERLSMIEAKDVEWVWPNRFPLGMASVIAGDPGCGKSTVVMDMAARITTGVAWPDDRDGTNPIGDVLFVTGEDSVAHTVRPRLDNAQGDASRVHILRGVRQPQGDHLIPLDLDSHARHLVGFLESHPEIRMVALDPLDAFMGGDCDTHRKSEVQRVLHGVAQLAETCNVAIVGVLHLRKNSNDKAIYRVLGSTGFVSAPRAVWGVERDRNDRGRRTMTALKVTNADEPTGLGFRIIDPGVIAWEDEPVTMSADEALQQRSDSSKENAEEWLLTTLALGPMESGRLFELARDEGFKDRTLWRAKKDLNVKARPIGGKQWEWLLPSECVQEA